MFRVDCDGFVSSALIGSRSTNVLPSPSTDVDGHVAAVVAGDVAHDRQAETRAAGRPAARPVDAIEPLEDTVEVALRDADALVGDADLDPVVDTPGANLHRAARLAVLDGVLDQVADRRHELTPITDDDQRVRLANIRLHRRQRRDRDPVASGQFRDSIDAGPDHVGDSDRLVRALGSHLDAGQLHQIVDRAAGTIRLGEHARDHAGDRVEVGLVDQRLGKHRQRADRRLQLVRDVGDEIGARLLDPAPLRDVVHERHAVPVWQRPGGDDERHLRRTEQLDRAVRHRAGAPELEVMFDRLVDEQPGVRACQAARRLVAVLDAAVRIPDHDPCRMTLEHVAERDVTRQLVAGRRLDPVSLSRAADRPPGEERHSDRDDDQDRGHSAPVRDPLAMALRSREPGAASCSGSTPVAMNLMRWAMLTAWSPRRS